MPKFNRPRITCGCEWRRPGRPRPPRPLLGERAARQRPKPDPRRASPRPAGPRAAGPYLHWRTGAAGSAPRPGALGRLQPGAEDPWRLRRRRCRFGETGSDRSQTPRKALEQRRQPEPRSGRRRPPRSLTSAGSGPRRAWVAPRPARAQTCRPRGRAGPVRKLCSLVIPSSPEQRKLPCHLPWPLEVLSSEPTCCGYSRLKSKASTGSGSVPEALPEAAPLSSFSFPF